MTKKRWGLVLLAIVILAGWWKWSPAKAEPQIAVIHVEGVILGGRGQSGLWGENGGVDGIIRQLHEARDDDAVKAIILRINSPGGSATASQELGEEILKVRAGGKPVVSSMGDIAASGGMHGANLRQSVNDYRQYWRIYALCKLGRTISKNRHSE